MAKVIPYLALCCLLCIGGQVVRAQSLNEDLLRCYQTFGSSSNLHLKMQISSFASAKSTQPMGRRTAEVKVSNYGYLTKMEHMTMLVSGDKALMVDEDSKAIFWQSLNKEQIRKLREDRDFTGLKLQLDSMLLNAQNINRKTIGDSIVVYSFSMENREISTVELTMNAKSGMFKRITYIYNEELSGSNGRVEVDYHYINTAPEFLESEFDTDKYFIKEGKTIKTTLAYERYNLYEIDFSDL